MERKGSLNDVLLWLFTYFNMYEKQNEVQIVNSITLSVYLLQNVA